MRTLYELAAEEKGAGRVGDETIETPGLHPLPNDPRR